LAAANKFEGFALELGIGDHHLDTGGDTFNIYLTNNAPSASADSIKTDLAGITEQNGYAPADTANDYTETSGTGTMTCVDVTVTATGTVGPFQYVVLYNDTHASDALALWWDYGSAITLANGETFKADFAASTLTIA